MNPGDLGRFKDSKTHFFVIERLMRSTPVGEMTPHLVIIINGIHEEVPEFWLTQHGEVLDEAR